MPYFSWTIAVIVLAALSPGLLPWAAALVMRLLSIVCLSESDPNAARACVVGGLLACMIFSWDLVMQRMVRHVADRGLVSG